MKFNLLEIMLWAGAGLNYTKTTFFIHSRIFKRVITNHAKVKWKLRRRVIIWLTCITL